MIYIGKVAGKQQSCELNFDSPRTQRAAEILGITIQDCFMKNQSKFFTCNTDKRIAQLAYEHHCNKVERNIKDLYDVRQRLIKKEEEDAAAGRREGPSLKRKTLPGHFPNPVKELLCTDTAIDVNKVMGHAERAELLEYLRRTWKEVTMVASDRKRKLAIQEHRARNANTASCSKLTSPCPPTKPRCQDLSYVSLEFNKTSKESTSWLPHVNDRHELLRRLSERKLLELEKEEEKEREWREQEMYLKTLFSKCSLNM